MRRVILLPSLLMVVLLLSVACGRSTTNQSAAQSSPSATVVANAVSLKILTPATGAAIKGNTTELQLDVSGISIVKADGDTSGKSGHFHVFVDRDPVAPGEIIPKDKGIIHSANNPILLTGLAVGDHKVVVVLGDGAHRRIGTVQATTSFTAAGPTLNVSAPATVAAGQPVGITATVQGVTLTKASEDTSKKDGTTGHLHVFVNKDPTLLGTPIPTGDPAIIHTAATEIQVPATLLKPGENTIWVVLGYADHTPFDPRVLDKVIVTVQQPAPGPSGSST